MVKNMSENTQRNQRPPLQLRLGLIAALIILAVVAAIFTFNGVRDFISTWEMTTLPGLSIKEPTPTVQAGTETGQEPEAPAEQSSTSLLPNAPQPQPWDGASRVTILVMGLDYRDWLIGEGPPRTDTMILLTLDPVSNTAGMLSIPRDLWVNIPGGYGYYKINQAYQLGEADRLPGGGPELARKTVENLLGVSIQYYAQVDFSAFVRFIDEIGGVKIDITDKIWIDVLGDDKGKIKIKPGRYTLPGDYALAYVRARNTEGADFDRAQRQQQVILAIRDRILRYDMIPTLITKAPVLFQELSSGVKTNLTFDEAFQLGWLAQQVPEENIKRGAIGTEQVNFGKSPDGLDILKPLPDQIRTIRDYVFASSGTIHPSAAEDQDPSELMAAESAKLSILNGTFTPGLAGLTSEYLQSQGANVTVIGDAEVKSQPYSIIYDYTGNPYTVRYLVDLLNISEFRIHFQYNPESEVDVAVILGDDWITNNPMP
jgi:LCP family protein required for cell wall assembly